jgi:NAD(P)H-nitrite reductase large subunit
VSPGRRECLLVLIASKNSQHRSVEQLYLNSPAWYAEQDPDRFVFHVGEQVTGLDHEARCVTTSKGRTIHVSTIL